MRANTVATPKRSVPRGSHLASRRSGAVERVAATCCVVESSFSVERAVMKQFPLAGEIGPCSISRFELAEALLGVCCAMLYLDCLSR